MGKNIVLYADGGCIAGRNPIWVHMTLTAVVRMSEKVGMLTRIGNNKAMVCTPGLIWGQQGTDAYNRRAKV